MFLPSLALSKLEDWSYEDALYYTFITLSTIGFGDLVAGEAAPMAPGLRPWHAECHCV